MPKTHEAFKILSQSEPLLNINWKADNLSPPDDYEGGLGYYSVQAPYVERHQDDSSFYVPCCASGFTRPLFGKAFAILTTIFREIPRTPDEAKLRDMIQKVELTSHKIRSKLLKMKTPQAVDFSAKLSADITKHKSDLRARRAIAIWPMLDSQVFYEEGIRFYDRENKIPNNDIFILSTSSGLLHPSEFYGLSYYEGICKECPPETFYWDNIQKGDSRYQAWDERCCDIIKRKLPDLVKNPEYRKTITNLFRPIYFANGIAGQHNNLNKFYLVLGYEHQKQTCLSAHERDVNALRKFFENKVIFSEIPKDIYEQQDNQFLRFYTLFGNNTLLKSSRLHGKYISHGWWYDLDFINKYKIDTRIKSVKNFIGEPPPLKNFTKKLIKALLTSSLITAIGQGSDEAIASGMLPILTEVGPSCLKYLASNMQQVFPDTGEYRNRIKTLAKEYAVT